MAGTGATIFEAIAAKEITSNSVNLPNPSPSKAALTIGDGSGADQDILLKFNTDRAWQFMQDNTAGNTALILKDMTGGKNFKIQDADGVNRITLAPKQSTSTTELINLDLDSNSASNIYAFKIVSDNAGAGKPGGIDFSSFSADEPFFKFVADAVSSLGTLTHQAAVDVGGTIYYIPLYTTGS